MVEPEWEAAAGVGGGTTRALRGRSRQHARREQGRARVASRQFARMRHSQRVEYLRNMSMGRATAGAGRPTARGPFSGASRASRSERCATTRTSHNESFTVSGMGYTLNGILLELLGLSAVYLQTQRAARCSSSGAGGAPWSADVARCTEDGWDKDVRQGAVHCLPSAKCVSSMFWIQKSERSLSRIRKVARLDASFLTGNKKKKMKEKGKQRTEL
jgi:hypothetical protein